MYRRTVSRLAGILFILNVACPLTAAESPGENHRVVLLGPVGPVLIDVRLQTGSQSIRQVRDAYCESLLKSLDADKSGHLEASELANLPAFRRPGGAPAAASQPFSTNGVMSFEGLKKYVDDQLGPMFAVEMKPRRLDQSVRFDLFDRDGDGRLSVSEVVNAAETLGRYDLDDDESLSVSELQPFPQSVREAQRASARPEESGNRVLLVDGAASADEAVASIRKVYAADQALPLDRCGVQQHAAPFDTDRNSALNADELKRWLLEGPPDVKLLARWQAPGTRLLPTLKIESEPSRRLAEEKSAGRRWEAKIDGFPLLIDITDNRFLAGESVKIMKTTSFAMSDRDKNKYLDEAEFASFGAAAPFDAVDLNHDKMITLPEIDEFFTRASQISQTRVVLTFSDDVVTLFQLMDADRTNRLSVRELRTLGERMAPLDRNGDGVFDSQDFASIFKLNLAFSVPPGLEFTPMAMATRNSTGGVRPSLRLGPVWYQRMDRNRDGDISWREFLGPRAKFDAIDTDRDGLISRDEAEKAGTESALDSRQQDAQTR